MSSNSHSHKSGKLKQNNKKHKSLNSKRSVKKNFSGKVEKVKNNNVKNTNNMAL
jgi:hypothetical protein